MTPPPKEPPLSLVELCWLIVGLIIAVAFFGAPFFSELIGAYLR